MGEAARPGPKPRRLYLRLVRIGDPDRPDLPGKSEVAVFIQNLERVGRLVLHGSLVDPGGDMLVLRAADRSEASRVLRSDPYQRLEGVTYEILPWTPGRLGSGVNLDPPPALGSGRLTVLRRVSVFVRDQAAAVAWYRDILGLTVREADPETSYVEISLGGGTAALSLVAPRADWGEPFHTEAATRVGVPTGIAFETDSVPALELRLRHAGAKVTEPARRQPWGGTTVRFADPDGNEFLAFDRNAASPATPRPMRSGKRL
ncbi:MAG: VOC family protein [Thermoplasmata archaeon]|nr:VOC family protein [Thermoplasmata archaeon]